MTTALLVIDMQNGFVHDKGSLPSNGNGLPNTAAVIAENRDLIAEARRLGVPVIYTRHVFRPDFVEAPARMEMLKTMEPAPLVRGSWDAEVVDDLAPADGDVIIDKSRYDAFLYTDLETVLRGKGITRLLVTGVVTSVCVESTVRSGHQRDFDMLVASDCVSAPESQHGPALEVMAAVFAEVAPWRELVAAHLR
ncbi:cysteine hydrolase family protein [Nocardioides humi]|uniref:Pyrimidine utilization protein B n=1 Tax=Nocardioides humi TaxID=449461 RepID=A0ABN1ZTX6_9ACTN|nr:cysteine hydrolase [Nocardioides humi]